jgi:hypothetical protein
MLVSPNKKRLSLNYETALQDKGVSFPMPEVLAGERGVSTTSWITIVIDLISMSNA